MCVVAGPFEPWPGGIRTFLYRQAPPPRTCAPGKFVSPVRLRGTLPNRLRDPTLSTGSFRKLLKTELIASYLAQYRMLRDSALLKSTKETDILPPGRWKVEAENVRKGELYGKHIRRNLTRGKCTTLGRALRRALRNPSGRHSARRSFRPLIGGRATGRRRVYDCRNIIVPLTSQHLTRRVVPDGQDHRRLPIVHGTWN